MAFDHERLRVYGRAVELVESVEGLVRGLGPGHASLADQIRRSSSSIVLNIAEGASEYSRKEKMRFYRMARRSAAETHAALNLLVAVRARTEKRVRETALLADDVSRMLAGLIRPAPPAPAHAVPAAPAPGPANASAAPAAPAVPAPANASAAAPAAPAAPAPGPANASASAPAPRAGAAPAATKP